MKILELSKLNEDKEMVWLEDPTKFEYVREGTFLNHHRNCKPLSKREERQFNYKLIGYEKNNDSNRIGKYIHLTMFYWLKSYDRGMPNENEVYGAPGAPEYYHPTEAVKIIMGKDGLKEDLP